MEQNMMESGSTMAASMDVLAPLLVAEIAVLFLFNAVYFVAVHTRLINNDDVAERIFFAFRRVRRFLGAGLGFSFFLFLWSFFLAGAAGLVLRDTSLTLFLLTGWGGLAWAIWTYFLFEARSKKARKKR